MQRPRVERTDFKEVHVQTTFRKKSDKTPAIKRRHLIDKVKEKHPRGSIYTMSDLISPATTHQVSAQQILLIRRANAYLAEVMSLGHDSGGWPCSPIHCTQVLLHVFLNNGSSTSVLARADLKMAIPIFNAAAVKLKTSGYIVDIEESSAPNLHLQLTHEGIRKVEKIIGIFIHKDEQLPEEIELLPVQVRPRNVPVDFEHPYGYSTPCNPIKFF